jgi:UDPglucose--hexose-1-phosphate uridylyltransferase
VPELRRDPVTGRWVIIAAERAKRPQDYPPIENTHVTDEGRKACPFCYGREAKTPPEVLSYRTDGSAPNTPGWNTRVVPNKFPALGIEGDLDRQGEGVYDRMNGIGAHEVIVETPDHDATLGTMPIEQIELTIRAFIDRIVDLEKDPRFKYIQVFKNFGEAAGASLEHPHCQLIATPVVPKRVAEELEGALTYFKYKERCVFCDIIRQESREAKRLVYADDLFVTFVPYAPRFPFEATIIPRRHMSAFKNMAPEEIRAVAVHLNLLAAKVDSILQTPPYNLLLHTAPSGQDYLDHYHWHMEFIPKLSKVAGFEWGTGLYINPTIPEHAAEHLRNGVK